MDPNALAPTEDGLENEAYRQSVPDDAGTAEPVKEYLPDAREADLIRLMQVAEANATSTSLTASRRTAWRRAYKASRNEHFDGSKYLSKDFDFRSKIFRPKTRSSVRRDMAATTASLFQSIDAITCSAGDDSNPQQRASAALMQELVKYRLDRSDQRASIPWFLTAIGARHDALHTGVCVSKQHWLYKTKKIGEEEYVEIDEFGQPETLRRDVEKVLMDRPAIILIPPENVTIDTAADWTDPAQSASFLLIKWPMRADEIIANQSHPKNPWLPVTKDQILALRTGGKQEDATIRQAREGSQGDRLDKVNTGSDRDWDVVWVWECYVRHNDEDLVFMLIEGKRLATKPQPVEEAHPAFDGARPIRIGYGSLEAHRIFPMAPVESWQQLQQEANDIANLSLDAMKHAVLPVTKVRRGRNVDLNALKRRGPNTTILVQDKDDVEWDRPPDVPASALMLTERINVDFDTLSGQFDAGSVQTNRNLNETVGGMKLLTGAANAVQEFDQRVWIETWVEPVMGQLVKLEQFYESDQRILAICGARGKLLQRFNVNEVSDQMLDEQVTIRVNVGLGAGDPQDRIKKFANAAQVTMAVLKGHPDFESGKKKVSSDAVIEEVFGAAGYRDAGARFFEEGEPKDEGANPAMMIELQKLMEEIKKIVAERNKIIAETEQTKVETRLKPLEAAHQIVSSQREDEQRQEDNNFRAQERDDKKEDKKIEIAERDKDRNLTRETTATKAAAKDGGKAAAPKKAAAPAPQPGNDNEGPDFKIVAYDRGPGGQVVGATIRFPDGSTKKVSFERGPDGRIMAARPMDVSPAKVPNIKGDPMGIAPGRQAPSGEGGLPPELAALVGGR